MVSNTALLERVLELARKDISEWVLKASSLYHASYHDGGGGAVPGEHSGDANQQYDHNLGFAKALLFAQKL
ncbi:hypothetical protein VTN96DRAFT_3312 [Rasamsonia emersonii]